METIVIFMFSMAVYGISNTIVFANGPFHIFKKMHEYLEDNYPMLNEGLSCMICCPWWVGMVISSINILFFPMFAITPMNYLLADKLLFPFIIFLDGAIASGMNWLIHTIQEAVERSNNQNE